MDVGGDKSGVQKHSLDVLAYPAFKNKVNNPYNYLLYSHFPADVQIHEYKRASLGRKQWDIFHIHWPDLLLRHNNPVRIWWRAQKLLRQIRRVQKNGGKVVWTAHNITAHNMPMQRLGMSLWTEILSAFDGIIYLSHASQVLVESRFPMLRTKASAVIPHGHYRGYYPPPSSALQQHPSTETSRVDLLMFGKIRPHRGVQQLLTAFRALEKREEVGLTLAGSLGKGEAAELFRQECGANVEHILRHIADSEVSAIFSRCSAVILPYTDILNSGTAILALSMNRPVIAPRMGSLLELEATFGPAWVYLYEPPLSPEVLAQAIGWVRARDRSLELDIGPLDWQPIAKATADFYRQLLAAKP